MRFAVLGAGAIGAYVGAALAKSGTDVVLIARGAHLEALRRDGVRVLSARGDFIAHPEVTDEFEAISGAAVVFLGLKAYSLPELAPRIGPLLSPDAAVIPAQNGIPWWCFQSFDGPLTDTVIESVDPGGLITRTVPPGSVVGCVPYPLPRSSHPESSATLRERGSRSVSRMGLRANVASASLRCSSQEASSARSTGRLRDQLWLKLLGNVAFNPVTALTGARSAGSVWSPRLVAVLRVDDGGGCYRRRGLG